MEVHRHLSGQISRTLVSFCSVLAILCMAFALQPARAEDGPDQDKPKKPRFEVSALTIRDNRSGLVWSLNGSISGITFSWYDAGEFVRQLNLERFAGYSDWRLPTREELFTLASHARDRGYDGSVPERTVAVGLQSIGIGNTQPKEYWSSTANLYNASEAWFVNMRDGIPGTGGKSLYLWVWPVRTAD